MSIAVSTVVQPSRMLFVMTAGMVTVVLYSGAALGFALVGELPLFWRGVVMLVCLLLVGRAVYRARCRQPRAIHVSGSGQIRLSVNGAQTEPVKMLPTSTLWPILLILHLQNANLHTETVVVLPDSVRPEEFKALLVACRWLAMRQSEGGHQAEIVQDI